MYEKILIPLTMDDPQDTSDLEEAAKSLGGKQTTFTLVHVVEDMPASAMMYLPEGMLDLNRKDAHDLMNLKALAFERSKTIVTSGKSGQKICDVAEKVGADCIVMRSHVPQTSDILFGSTAAYVVRHANCSVHVLR